VRVLAVIPARGQSKGVPRKNLRLLGGVPLLSWSVDAAFRSKFITDVCVSTEDQEIAEVARQAMTSAAKVFTVEGLKQWDLVDRPSELATDTASTDSVLLNAIQRRDEVPEVVVLLQPTCPIRRAGLVDDVIRRLFDTDADSCFTAYKIPAAFLWQNHDRGPWADSADWRAMGGRRVPRQEMTAGEYLWREDGSVYAVRGEVLLRKHARIAGRVQVCPNEETVDIDTEADFALAEALVATAHRDLARTA
jgi:CMP-N,N'-diacetyllegionaminic acid synthase